MKNKHIPTKALSMLMAVAMLIAVASPMVGATVHGRHTYEFANGKEELHYVALGDSMTSGVGLSGYDECGYLEVAPEAYPALFAQWLAGSSGDIAEGQTEYVGEKGTVHLTQLSTSAMRVEDLYYILTYGSENAYPGDEWTRTKLLGGEIAGISGSESAPWGSDGIPWGSTVETFQGSVADADIITIAAGNGNFGVYLLNGILDAMGMHGDGYHPDYDYATLENALKLHGLDEQMKTTVLNIYNAFSGSISGVLPVEQADAAADRIAYTVASFLLSYNGVIDRVVELNPDAEIMILGLLNTLAGTDDTVLAGELTLGKILHIIYSHLNQYLATLPVYKQETDPATYGEAVFYYAHAESIDCIVDEMAEQLEDPHSVHRSHFITSIVGTQEDPGMIWNLLDETPLMDDLTLTYITEEQIQAYIGYTEAQRAQYAAENPQDAVSISVYMAFEKALVELGARQSASLKSIMALGDLDAGLFEGVMSDFTAHLDTVGAAYRLTAAEVVASIANSSQNEIVFDANTIDALVARDPMGDAFILEVAFEQATKMINQQLGSDVSMDIIKDLYGNDEDYDHAITESVDMAKDIVAEMIYETYDLDGSVAQLCMLLAVPDALSDSLQSDETVSGLLSLFSRCMVADGLASHPSVKGHAQLFEAIKTSYRDGYTAQDEVDASMKGNYVIDDDSCYVALTGEGSAYADLLAEALHLDTNTQFFKMTWETLDYSVLAQADLITVGYDEAQISAFAVNQTFAYVRDYLDNDLRSSVDAYVNRALSNILDDDMVGTISDSVHTLLNDLLNQEPLTNKEKQPMDWVALLGEDQAQKVAELLSLIRSELISSGIPETYVYTIDVVPYISDAAGFRKDKLYEWLGEDAYFTIEFPVADGMMYAIESYLYSFVSFQKTYSETLVALLKMNPDASVVLLGQYNPFMGVEIALGDTVMSLDEVYSTVTSGMSAVSRLYAYMGLHVSYVDIPATETIYMEEEDAYSWMDVLTTPSLTYPSAAGHAYIAEQILASVTFSCDHKYVNCEDTDCGRCGEVREAPGHTEIIDEAVPPTCTESGLTEGKHCSGCGEIFIAQETIPAVGHDWADATCAAPKTCKVCGETEGEALGHDFGEATCSEPATCTRCDAIDGEALGHTYDNACDADCNVCGETRTPADHDYGEWETTKEPAVDQPGEKRRVCSVCSHEEVEIIPALEPETTDTPETEPVTEPDVTDAPETGTETDLDTETDPEKQNGCNSAFVSGVALWALMGAAVLAIKKKKD